MSRRNFSLLILLFSFAFPAIAPALCDCPADAVCAASCNPSAPHDDEDRCELCVAPQGANAASEARAGADQGTGSPAPSVLDAATGRIDPRGAADFFCRPAYLPADGSAYARVSSPLRP